MNSIHHDASFLSQRINQLNQRLLGPSDVAERLGVSADWIRDQATPKEPPPAELRAFNSGADNLCLFSRASSFGFWALSA
jgi:hypothetical protein